MKKVCLSAAIILTVVSFSICSYGKDKDNSAEQFDNNTVQNFIMGINSDNQGLCESCIYYAGYYRINGTVEALVSVLNDNSKNPVLRILAAVSLYRIGDVRGIRAIRDVVQFDKSESVKTICSRLYNEYLNHEEIFYSIGL